MHRSFAFFFVTILIVAMAGCSDEGDNIGEEVGNAKLVMGFEGNKTVEGLGINVKKMKVWQTANNSNSGGASTVVSLHTVEMWYTLDNDGVSFSLQDEEETDDGTEQDTDDSSRLRYAYISELISDSDGNLYFEDAEPGTVVYEAPGGNESSLTDEGLLTYERDAESGLVSTKFAPNTIFSRTKGSRTARKVIQGPTIDDSPWTTVFEYGFGGDALIGWRAYYESNEELETKGSVGCLYQKSDDGDLEDHQFYFGEAELGNIIQHTKNRDTAASVDDTDDLGNDDKLWIKWDEYWHLVGLNYRDKTMKVMRTRVAPIYTGRELPGVDTSDDSPSLSGYDAMVRKCNETAGEGGQFNIISEDVSVATSTGTSITANLSIGTTNSYCQTLDDADKDDLNTTSTVYDTCAFTIPSISAGNWDGTQHTGPVTAPSSSLDHIEMSEPTAVQF